MTNTQRANRNMNGNVAGMNYNGRGIVAQQLRTEDVYWKFRRVWLEHVYLTRLFIVSALGNLPDAEATAGILMTNQKNIGDAIDVFYPGYGVSVTEMLKKHIQIAAELVSVLKINGLEIIKVKSKTSEEIRKQWYDNADQMSSFFQQLNQMWTLRNPFHSHIKLTDAYLTSRNSKDYVKEIEYFQGAVEQSKEIADILAGGIIQQKRMLFR